MNFDLDEGQREFAAMAGKFYSASAGPATARAALGSDAPAPGLKAVADLGFYGIVVPEESGGIGQKVLDAAVVAEQAGRALASPSMVTAVRAAILLEGQSELLSALADGSTAFSVLDDGIGIDAVGAQKFLALQDGALVIGTGEVSTQDPIDATRGLGKVSLLDTDVLVPDAADLWERAKVIATVILAAEDLGTAARALELGVEYANMREAFGRKIGSYQAIKHLLVDVYVGVEQLRSLVWWAAWSADESPEDLPVAASAAKALSAEVIEQATEGLIQVHGGIGFTWEHDAHLFWRRAKVDRLLLGDAASHYDTVARLSLSA